MNKKIGLIFLLCALSTLGLIYTIRSRVQSPSTNLFERRAPQFLASSRRPFHKPHVVRGKPHHKKHRSHHPRKHHRKVRRETIIIYPGYYGYSYAYPPRTYGPHRHIHHGPLYSDKGGYPYWEITNNAPHAVILQTQDGKRRHISAHNQDPIQVYHESGFEFDLYSNAGRHLGHFQIVDHFIEISENPSGRIIASGSN